ncbi:hypothetical protein LJC46_02045 [Desulfovibrio sp. OttesenSCG-928-G15]|nr:hypothetical protein [Desulfovibrio sp. OttesenSCG-928-G15]
MQDNYYWMTQDGIYSTADAAFVDAAPAGKSLTPLYMDTSDADNLVLADAGFLRSQIVFYSFAVPDSLLTDAERIAGQQAAFTAAIQARLDTFAQGRNYDSALACATYATSTNPRFAAEGQYMVEARDATWATGYEILDAVISGARAMPTIDDVLAELPPLSWPDDAAKGGA